MTSQLLKIKDILVDQIYQSREKINPSTVNEYAEAITAGATFPAVIVFQCQQQLILVEGFHRIAAYQKIGALEVEAEVHIGSTRDALLRSLASNATHGLPRSNDDKRKVLLTLLDDVEWESWSDNEIASHCSVSRSLVQKVRSSLATKASEKVERSYITKHGTEAKMKVQNIGQSQNPVSQEYEPQPLTYEDGKDEMTKEIVSLIEENEALQAKLLIQNMDVSFEEKQAAATLIEVLRDEIKALDGEVRVITASRDSFQRECAELKKQVSYWERRAKKVEKVATNG
jgi:hypothetical protein